MAEVPLKFSGNTHGSARGSGASRRPSTGYCDRYSPESLGTLSVETLRDAVRDFLDIRLNRWNDAALADTAAMVCYGLLGLAVRSAFAGEEETALHNTLLKGLPILASNAPVAQLWNLRGGARRRAAHAAPATLLRE